MAPLPIIGLLGRSRCGKDTVAAILLEMSIQPYAIVRLSAPIKDAARALFAFDNAQIEGGLKETVDQRWGVAPRQVFQTMTTEVMKHMGPDHFTRLLYAKHDNGVFGPRIIVPDVRYIHDVKEIRRRGGIVVKVERTHLEQRHECEDHLDAIGPDDGIFATVRNDGTIDELRECLKDHGRFLGLVPGAHVETVKLHTMEIHTFATRTIGEKQVEFWECMDGRNTTKHPMTVVGEIELVRNQADKEIDAIVSLLPADKANMLRWLLENRATIDRVHSHLSRKLMRGSMKALASSPRK